jgi:hypothetical protein
VSALGGKVVVKGGSSRVMGLLAMTRAIGDHFLRPYVIPEPEVGWLLLFWCFFSCWPGSAVAGSGCVVECRRPQAWSDSQLSCKHLTSAKQRLASLLAR